MNREYLIGVDAGTQSVKAALYSPDGVCRAEYAEPCGLQHPEPGAVTQDPEAILSAVLRCVGRVAEAAKGGAAALSVSAQMAGILGVGPDGRAVTPYDSWLDTRCAPYAKRMERELGDALPRITGGQANCSHGPKMLWWKHEHPESYRRVFRFVTLSAYIAMRLCGLTAEEAFIDDTHLHFTGFADNQNRVWHDGLLAAMGMDREKLPPIVRPDAVAGTLTAGMAALCGLKSGVPVAAGCGDSTASAYGAGIAGPGLVYDVAGTASVFSCSTERFLPDTREKTVLMTRSVVDGLYNGLAYISGGGMCLKWYADQYGVSLRELDEAAAPLPAGSGGLYFIPHFSGRACPSVPAVRGGWMGLSFHHKSAHLYRAILESVAYEYRMYLDILRRCDPLLKPAAVIGAGGGAKSALFAQIKADVLGVPYRALRNVDTATRAGAVIAGRACGCCPRCAARYRFRTPRAKRVPGRKTARRMTVRPASIRGCCKASAACTGAWANLFENASF